MCIASHSLTKACRRSTFFRMLGANYDYDDDGDAVSAEMTLLPSFRADC